jgi:hypothetical protein
LFYVPNEMEYNIIQTTHDKIGHLGINKTYDDIRSIYWFPVMKEKIQKYIDNCLRCIIDRGLRGSTSPTSFCKSYLDK